MRFISIDLQHTCSIVLIIKVREYFRFSNEYLLHTNRSFMPIERVQEKAHERLDVLGTNEIPIIYYNQFQKRSIRLCHFCNAAQKPKRSGNYENNTKESFLELDIHILLNLVHSIRFTRPSVYFIVSSTHVFLPFSSIIRWVTKLP